MFFCFCFWPSLKVLSSYYCFNSFSDSSLSISLLPNFSTSIFNITELLHAPKHLTSCQDYQDELIPLTFPQGVHLLHPNFENSPSYLHTNSSSRYLQILNDPTWLDYSSLPKLSHSVLNILFVFCLCSLHFLFPSDQREIFEIVKKHSNSLIFQMLLK